MHSDVISSYRLSNHVDVMCDLATSKVVNCHSNRPSEGKKNGHSRELFTSAISEETLLAMFNWIRFI